MTKITSFPIPRFNMDLSDPESMTALQDWIDDITKYLFDLNQQIQTITDTLSVGLSTTQTFKDGSGTTKTMTIQNGRIVNIA